MPPPLPLCLRTAMFAGVSIVSFALPQAGTAQAVTDSPAPGSASSQLPGIVVTATRSPERIEDLVADISVIDGDLDRRGLNLQEVLRFGGGVQLTSYGGPAATSNVLIRGANAGHTLTLFEGFRVSSSLLGQTTFETLPLTHVRRLELLRGPGSALYGADALGGVVQLFAPTASSGLRIDGEASAGQEGTRRLQAGLSGGSEALSGGIRLSSDSSDGFNATTPNNFAYNPDRDGYRRAGVSAFGDARLGPGTRLRGILLQNRLSADYDDGPFPGARVKARMELIGLTGTHDIDPLTQVTFRIGQSTDKSDNRSSFPGEFTSRQMQYGVSATRQLTPAARAQVLLERLEERASSTSYASGASVRRITDSAGLVLVGDQGPHLLQASARLDHSDQYDSQTNYSLSYGYRLGGGLRAGAAYATGFHAPGFNDLYFPNYGRTVIRPERSRSAEVGLYWNQPDARDTGSSTGSPAASSIGGSSRTRAGGPLALAGAGGETDEAAGMARGWHAKAVLFQSRVRDLISYTAVCPDPSPEFSFGCASNVDRARIEGLSLGLGQRRPGAGSPDASGFGWYLNVDFLDPRDRTTGTRLARRAARQLTAGTEYGHGRTSLGADLVVASRRFDDAANLSELGGYAVLNLRAAYRVSREWEAFATVSNAGDRDYATARDYVQQGRLVMLGARYQSR